MHDLAIGESATKSIVARNTWNDTGIRLVAGQEYRFTAVGEWIDWYIRCGPEGYPSFTPLPLPFLARPLEWLRRAPREQWFALIGAIDRNPQTQFRIGTQRTLIAPATGMLTCFANDIMFFYWNNIGSVDLTITRTR